MDNTNFKVAIVMVAIIGFIATIIVLNKDNQEKTIVNLSLADYENEKHRADSLQNVIDSLQIEIFSLEDGFDYKEHRYEDVVFQYELGLSYIKDYHPNAYKDFHRIIAHKERYSHEVERENTKILNQYK
jgi:hypothetical protein